MSHVPVSLEIIQRYCKMFPLWFDILWISNFLLKKGKTNPCTATCSHGCSVGLCCREAFSGVLPQFYTAKINYLTQKSSTRYFVWSYLYPHRSCQLCSEHLLSLKFLWKSREEAQFSDLAVVCKSGMESPEGFLSTMNPFFLVYCRLFWAEWPLIMGYWEGISRPTT